MQTTVRVSFLYVCKGTSSMKLNNRIVNYLTGLGLASSLVLAGGELFHTLKEKATVPILIL